jgi:DNA (cytosine-5)-methyltransferase 1
MTYERPTHLDLFSGIGGFSISAEAAGFRTIAFVEREPYCQKVLAQHWPSVPIYNDICQFGGRSLGPISLLTGGFPCQPFSVAGERRGKGDDRYLWPEMLRVIQATDPDWIIGENVAGLDGLGLDDCISDLEASGYEVAPPLEIPACAVDARHVRNRLWIVANAVRKQAHGHNARRFLDQPTGSSEVVADAAGERQREQADKADAITISGKAWNESGDGRQSLADTNRPGREELDAPGFSEKPGLHTGSSDPRWQQWPAEPELGRVAHGIPNRTHRLKGLGNAIVPAVAFQIIKAIYDIQVALDQSAERKADSPLLAAE